MGFRRVEIRWTGVDTRVGWSTDLRALRMAAQPVCSPSLMVASETSDFAGVSTSGYITQLTVVPEPGTLALLAFGALTVARRKKQTPC
jgi:hypothetical protein